jgi:hypothetical protein
MGPNFYDNFSLEVFFVIQDLIKLDATIWNQIYFGGTRKNLRELKH